MFVVDRLIKVGKIKPKKSTEVKTSRIGIGFEKLDRNVFDPNKAYDPVGELGIKWVRLQSGWQRTEREKGVYDFKWLDDVVDNLIKRGLKPWLCLCYGNDLYTESAKNVFGAVGCPPIHTEEEKTAWKNYVLATAQHFKGRIDYYEVWNEPDGLWCWKHGVNATELGKFTLATAKFVKEADCNAKVVGGVTCKFTTKYLNEAFQTGMGTYLDAISYHEYTSDETEVLNKVRAYRALAHKYNPDIEIVQGESGSQSKRGGNGALHWMAWTPERQAKQLARHTMVDLISGVKFTSYFSTMDMIEALNGLNSDKSSYQDYGYFGVLSADFDENGFAIGSYSKKPSYYVLQNIASLFSDDITNADLPLLVMPSRFDDNTYEMSVSEFEMLSGGFEKNGCYAYAYWKPTNIMTTSFMGSVSIEASCMGEEVYLADVMDGTVYEIPEEIKSVSDDGTVTLKNLPVKDTPLVLIFGKDFIDFE